MVAEPNSFFTTETNVFANFKNDNSKHLEVNQFSLSFTEAFFYANKTIVKCLKAFCRV